MTGFSPKTQENFLTSTTTSPTTSQTIHQQPKVSEKLRTYSQFNICYVFRLALGPAQNPRNMGEAPKYKVEENVENLARISEKSTNKLHSVYVQIQTIHCITVFQSSLCVTCWLG